MFDTNSEIIRAYFAAHAPKVPQDFPWKQRPDPRCEGTICESPVSRMVRWRWEYADAMVYEGTKNGSLE